MTRRTRCTDGVYRAGWWSPRSTSLQETRARAVAIVAASVRAAAKGARRSGRGTAVAVVAAALVSTSQKQVSSMVVRDQQTVVIGGLLSDEVLTSESKVPLLGDIPILGFFFKQQGKQVIKRNLLVVITPHIIRDQADLRRVFKRKLEEREEFLRRYGALRERENLEKVDYGSKRGLLAEIDRAAREAESEAALTKEAGRARGMKAERVELPATRPATE